MPFKSRETEEVPVEQKPEIAKKWSKKYGSEQPEQAVAEETPVRYRK